MKKEQIDAAYCINLLLGNPWKYLGVAFIEGICLALILWVVNFYTVSTTHRSWKRFSAGILMALVFAGGAAAWKIRLNYRV
jgi:hypothetical protein